MLRCLVLSLTVLSCLAAMPRQQARFRSGVETVRVDVLAARGGQPVVGLTAKDFEIRDNGVLQQIDRVAFEELPLSLVVALDTSGSVEGERARHLRAASHNLLERLKPEDQAALVTFGDAVVVRSTLTHDVARLHSALDEALPHGDTSLIDAAQTALLLGESQAGRALLIVFSDGVEVSSYLEPDRVLGTAKRSDVVVYGVALRSVGKPPFLRELIEASGGDLFASDSTRDLDAAFASVLDQFRHRYLVSYTPQGVARAGWHRLQVRLVGRPGVGVRARPGYLRE
jgi:Ca-activated chloride channel family protein